MKDKFQWLNNGVGKRIDAFFETRLGRVIWIGLNFAFNWLGRWSASNDTKALKKKIVLLESAQAAPETGV